MRRRLSFLLSALLLFALFFGVFGGVARAADYSMVRVLLSTGSVNSLTIPVSGSYFIEENGATFENGTLTVQASGGQLYVNHSARGQLYTGSKANIMRANIDPGAGYLRVTTSHGTKSYLGHLSLRCNSAGAIEAVNRVPLAHYLYGVVNYEMNNLFPLEALKAQAVAAKCYVLNQMSSNSYYDIGDTSKDQVYKGYDSGAKNVKAAVDATLNVGLYLGSSVLCSYFAASNGGSTILPSEAWGGTNRYIWDNAFAKISDPYDVKNPLSVQETAFLPKNGEQGGMSTALSNYLRAKVAKVLNDSGRVYGGTVVSIDGINDFRIQKDSAKGSSEIVGYIDVTATVRDAYGSTTQTRVDYTFYMDEFKWNAVFTKTQSLRLYTITDTGNGYQLYRGRYGHGVGMSQRGAEQMANEGFDYQRILQFYYPGASIRTMEVTPPSNPANGQGGGSVAPPPPTNPSTPGTGEIIATAVTTGAVNLRQGPGTNYTRLGEIPAGASVNVYGETNNWSLVEYRGTTGYVSNDYLRVTPVSGGSSGGSGGSSGGASSGDVVAYGEVTSNTLNMRAKAVNGTVLQRLSRGDTIEIIGYVENSTWYYCTAKGVKGYVSAQYVKLTGTPSAAPGQGGGAGGGNTGSSMAGPGSIGVINNEVAYWYQSPVLSPSNAMGRFPNGSQLTLEGSSGEFYIVTLNNVMGYVHYKDLTITKPTGGGSSASGGSSSGGASSTLGSGETTGSVNFRKGPGTGYTSMGMLKKGTKLTVHSKQGGWYAVTANNKDGYVSASYVKITSGGTGAGSSGSSGSSAGSGSSSGSSAGSSVRTGRVVNEWVRLRSSASYDSQNNILGTYDVGTELVIYELSGGWYRVQTPDGKQGYMHGDYVTVTGTLNTRTGITTGRVNMRKEASTSGGIIKTLSKGTSVTILGETGDWYKIQAGSSTGYAVKQYIGG